MISHAGHIARGEHARMRHRLQVLVDRDETAWIDGEARLPWPGGGLRAGRGDHEIGRNLATIDGDDLVALDGLHIERRLHAHVARGQHSGHRAPRPLRMTGQDGR